MVQCVTVQCVTFKLSRSEGDAGGPTETRPGRLLHWHSLEVVFHLEVTESRRRARRRLQPAPGPGTGNTLSARARQPGRALGSGLNSWPGSPDINLKFKLKLGFGNSTSCAAAQSVQQWQP